MFLLSDFPFPCHYCEEQLQLPLLLEKHIEQNHPNKQDRFIESNVDERYEYELKGLIENLGRRYDPLLYKCYFCDSDFLSVQHLDLHLKKAHKNGQIITCKFCKTMFNKNDKYLNHMVDAHQVKMEFKCSFCKDKFKDLREFKRHRQVHWEEKGLIKYTCEICQQGFRSMTKLNIHQCDYRKGREEVVDNDR